MKLDETVLADIEVHATDEYPNECCGLVVTTAEGSQRVIRLRNIQDRMHAEDPERFPRTARTAYYPDSRDLVTALAEVHPPGSDPTAFYHSHPDHDAYFSDEDVRQATPFGEPSYPDSLQVVVSVYDRRVRAVKAYRWSALDAAYVETPFCAR